MRPYLDLVRLPNLFTAAADVLAGFFFVGGASNEWFEGLRLVFASMCLYASGVALNDVCDAAQDALEQPSRPIPSGQIRRDTALWVALGLGGLGMFIAGTVSARSLLVSTAIFACVIFYNLLKPTVVAAPMMGVCRALNLLLGMSGVQRGFAVASIWPMAAMFVYVTSLTLFARREAGGGSKIRLVLATAGMSMAVLGLAIVMGASAGGHLLVAGMLLAMVLTFGITSVVYPEPARIQRSVKALVMGIVLLDAFVAWSAADWLAGAVVAALLVPGLWLGRFFRVT
jgi:hypothetical protein